MIRNGVLNWVSTLFFALALAAGCSSDDGSGGGLGDGAGGNGDGSGALAGDGSGTGLLGGSAGDGSQGGDGSGASGNGAGGSGASGDGAGGSGSGNDGSGSGNDGSGAAGSGGGTLPSNIPTFPGAGTSDAALPLENGMLCDAVAGDTVLPVAPPPATCFSDPNALDAMTAATLEQVLECVEDTNALHIRLTFHPWFVDNTYGENAIGWNPKRPHTMDPDLAKSDHAEIIIKDGDGNTVMQFKLDYISADPSSPSGYGSLGVTGGDGAIIVGDAADVIDWTTSLDRNLNERGYGDYTVDSPATDEDYTPNPDTPEWDYRVVYEAWIDLSVFDGSSFEGATIEYVHASPAKTSSDTINVEPGECPPPPGDDSPPGDDMCLNAPDVQCAPDTPPGGGGGTGGAGGDGAGGTGGGGTPQDPCNDNNPDTFCGGGGVGGAGSGAGGTGGSSGSGAGGTGGSSGSGAGGTGGGGTPQDPCNDNNPDTFCWPGGGGTGGSGDPQYCADHPTDPICNVD